MEFLSFSTQEIYCITVSLKMLESITSTVCCMKTNFSPNLDWHLVISNKNIFMQFGHDNFEESIKIAAISDSNEKLSIVGRDGKAIEIWLDDCMMRCIMNCSKCNHGIIYVGKDPCNPENNFYDESIFECHVGTIPQQFIPKEIPIQIVEEQDSVLQSMGTDDSISNQETKLNEGFAS